MSDQTISPSAITDRPRKGLSPAEVLIYNVCSKETNREEIFNEVISKIEVLPSEPHTAFQVCLETLKKRGLIVY